jgi:predicted metalloprotease
VLSKEVDEAPRQALGGILDDEVRQTKGRHAGMGGFRSVYPFAIVGLALAMAACSPEVTPTPFRPATATPAVELPSAPMTQEQRVDKVQADAAGLVPLLNDFWTTELQSVYGIAFDPPDRVLYYEPPRWDPCGSDTQNWTNNAFYCPLDGDEKVEYDLNWFQEYLVRYPGGATTFYILAHEWGHAVQDTWLESGGKDEWTPAYRKELNADCLSGVFIDRSIDDGLIVEEEGDAEAIYTRLFEGGSKEGWLNPGSHGTSEERQRAFADGFVNGTAYCRTNY